MRVITKPVVQILQGRTGKVLPAYVTSKHVQTNFYISWGKVLYLTHSTTWPPLQSQSWQCLCSTNGNFSNDTLSCINNYHSEVKAGWYSNTRWRISSKKRKAVQSGSQTMIWAPAEVHKTNIAGCAMINELRMKNDKVKIPRYCTYLLKIETFCSSNLILLYNASAAYN